MHLSHISGLRCYSRTNKPGLETSVLDWSPVPQAAGGAQAAWLHRITLDIRVLAHEVPRPPVDISSRYPPEANGTPWASASPSPPAPSPRPHAPPSPPLSAHTFSPYAPGVQSACNQSTKYFPCPKKFFSPNSLAEILLPPTNQS